MSGGLADNIVSAGSAGFRTDPVGGRYLEKKFGSDFLGDPLDIFGRRRQKAEEEARRLAEKRERLERRREVVETIRGAQIQREDLAAVLVSQGADGSSAGFGGLGSIQSQQSGNITFFNQQMNLRSGVEKRLQRAVHWETISNSARFLSNITSRFQ